MRVQNVGGQIVLSLTPREAEKIGIVTSVTAAPSAPAERTFKTKAERLAGLGYPCSVPGEDCGRRDLRTPNRASIHGIEAGGHAPKS